MTELKQRILTAVQKPARYTGGEWGEVKKDLSDVRVRVASCFPLDKTCIIVIRHKADILAV